MEIKCSVCGTMNDRYNTYCVGCFLPLNKTMQQWTHEIENKINDSLDKKEIVEPVVEEDNKDIWQEQPNVTNSLENETTILPGIQPLAIDPVIPPVPTTSPMIEDNSGIQPQAEVEVSQEPVLTSIEPTLEENVQEQTNDSKDLLGETTVLPNIQQTQLDSTPSIPLEPIVEQPMEPIPSQSIEPIDENIPQSIDESVLSGETTILPNMQQSIEETVATPSIPLEPIVEQPTESMTNQNVESLNSLNENLEENNVQNDSEKQIEPPIEIEISEEPVYAIIEPIEDEDDIEEQNGDSKDLLGETTVLPNIQNQVEQSEMQNIPLESNDNQTPNLEDNIDNLNGIQSVTPEKLDLQPTQIEPQVNIQPEPLVNDIPSIEQPNINSVQPVAPLPENNQVDIPLDVTFINQEAINSNAMPYTAGPIQSGKNIGDIKNELQDVSIIKQNDLSDKGKSAISLTIKFDLILIILSLAFTFIYGTNINDTTNILFGALSTILFSAIAIFITFRKNVPKEKETNKTYILIFTTMTLFELILRNVLFYTSSFSAIYAYIFISVLYILISIMILNAISRFVRKNRNEVESSKFISRMNIIVLVIIAILVVIGVVVRNNSTQEVESNPDPITVIVPDELYSYIETINDTIISNIQNDENYEIPESITDPNFVDAGIEIDEVSLKIDEYGTVESGEVKYNGISYRYREKTFIAQG